MELLNVDSNDIADLIGRTAKLSPAELKVELEKVAKQRSIAQEGLSDSVFESALLFMKISDWMNTTQADFEGMLANLQKIQEAHDSALLVASGKMSS